VLFSGDTVHGPVGADHPDPEHWGRAPSLYLAASYGYVRYLGPRVTRLQASLRPILAEAFDLICSAHSMPYRRGAKAALTRLLSLDWEALLRAGRRPIVYTELLEPDAPAQT
jgi:hypothetical protein